MATRLVYLEGFDVVNGDAIVTVVSDTLDGRKDIQLDKTCFYPRGGGQDWDKGTITSADGSAIFLADEVRLDEKGIVHHLGTYQSGELRSGDTVQCVVDATRRSINSRLHSAGHVIDMALNRLGRDWVPHKAGHYPDMCFVEYGAELTPEEAEQARVQIEQGANELVAAGSHNEVRFLPIEEMHTVCRHVPTNIPTNKPARVVMYSDHFGIPCGGTHVRDIHTIGHITIAKVKSKQGITKVSYAVGGD